MESKINVAISKELREKLEPLKIIKQQPLIEVLNEAVNLLIQERNLVEQTKNFKNFRIIKGRKDQDYCSLCGRHECLLVEGQVSREKLNIEPISSRLMFCERCLKLAVGQFSNPKDIART